MVTPYPLEALRGLRAEEEESAKRGLALAVQAHAKALEALAHAEAQLSAHEAATQAAVARELERPLNAQRASDAVQLRAWRERRSRERAELQASITRAHADVAARDLEVSSARDALAHARREREAIEKHHARWQDDAKRRREAKEEADAEDRPRR